MFYGYFQSNGHNFYLRNKFNVHDDIEQKRIKFEKEKAKRIEKLIKEDEEDEYVSGHHKSFSMPNNSIDNESLNSYSENHYLDGDAEESKHLNRNFRRSIGSPRIKDSNLPKINRVDTPPVESESIRIQEIQEDIQQIDSVENMNEPIKKSLCEKISYQVIPRTLNDWIAVSLFWSNILCLFLFMIINVSIYDEAWIPLVSFFWVLIFELGFLGLSKYYYSRYDYKKLWFLI